MMAILHQMRKQTSQRAGYSIPIGNLFSEIGSELISEGMERDSILSGCESTILLDTLRANMSRRCWNPHWFNI